MPYFEEFQVVSLMRLREQTEWFMTSVLSPQVPLSGNNFNEAFLQEDGEDLLAELNNFIPSAGADENVSSVVSKILSDIKSEGDLAVLAKTMSLME